jgi:TRAP-type C4-dicarboxylate transport system permease small subunit
MIASVFVPLDRAVAAFCKWAAILCFIALFILLGLSVIARNVTTFTIPGHDEIVELLFIWITFLTSLALWREGALYRVALFENVLSRAGQKVLEILINLCMLAFALVLVVYGWDFMLLSGETTPFLRLDRSYWYASIPFCGVLMAAYSIVWIWRIASGRGSLEKDVTLGS